MAAAESGSKGLVARRKVAFVALGGGRKLAARVVTAVTAAGLLPAIALVAACSGSAAGAAHATRSPALVSAGSGTAAPSPAPDPGQPQPISGRFSLTFTDAAGQTTCPRSAPAQAQCYLLTAQMDTPDTAPWRSGRPSTPRYLRRALSAGSRLATAPCWPAPRGRSRSARPVRGFAWGTWAPSPGISSSLAGPAGTPERPAAGRYA